MSHRHSISTLTSHRQRRLPSVGSEFVPTPRITLKGADDPSSSVQAQTVVLVQQQQPRISQRDSNNTTLSRGVPSKTRRRSSVRGSTRRGSLFFSRQEPSNTTQKSGCCLDLDNLAEFSISEAPKNRRSEECADLPEDFLFRRTRTSTTFRPERNDQVMDVLDSSSEKIFQGISLAMVEKVASDLNISIDTPRKPYRQTRAVLITPDASDGQTKELVFEFDETISESIDESDPDEFDHDYEPTEVGTLTSLRTPKINISSYQDGIIAKKQRRASIG